jgi:peptide/nickel transport system substrate-binding protein
MNLSAGLPTLDPAFARDQASGWMVSQLFCGLVEIGPDLEVKPLLAQRWEISDSGRTYTFHLRSGVLFHAPSYFAQEHTHTVSARDVAFSFTRICDPVVASPGFWIFNEKVVGAKEYNAGEKQSVEGFEIKNDSTFVIHLTKPFPPFLGLLGMPFASVVMPEAVQKFGKDFRSHPVGCGPFVLKSWKEGSHLILHRNPDYFEKAGEESLPLLDAVQVRFMSSRASEFAEFTRGNLDFVNNLDKSVRDEVYLPGGQMKPEYVGQFTLQIIPQLNTEFLSIQSDPQNPLLAGHPLADVRVRKALALCIDRENLVRFVLNGNGSPAHSGLVPMGLPAFDSAAVRGFRHDPAQASALLAEAGYPGGKGLPPITLSSTAAYQPAMEYVQKCAARVGIALRIDNMQGSALRQKANEGGLLFWRAGWIADYPDAENYLALGITANHPPNGPNRMRFSSSRYDSLFSEYLLATTDSARWSISHQAENVMLAEVPVIPLYYDCVVRLISPRIQGLETNSMNSLFLKSVTKQPR